MLQQISYVAVKGESLTFEQQEFLDQIIPSDRIREVYDPFVADNVKFDESFDNKFLDANSGEFLKVWSQLLWKYPADYIKAYAMLTIGYWHPLTENRIAYFGITSSEASSYGIVSDGNNLFHLASNLSAEADSVCILHEHRLPVLDRHVPVSSISQKGQKTGKASISSALSAVGYADDCSSGIL